MAEIGLFEAMYSARALRRFKPDPVPDEIIARMSRAATGDAARAEGVAIAREMLSAVHGLVQGAQISAPMGRYSSAMDVLEALGSSKSTSA